MLRQTGVDVVEAALITKTALEAGRGRVKRAVECINMGAETLRARERTVSFERAVVAALEERKDRRKRTLTDFRYITKRFMKKCKGLAKRRVWLPAVPERTPKDKHASLLWTLPDRVQHWGLSPVYVVAIAAEKYNRPPCRKFTPALQQCRHLA